jgi:hypothetical protein
MKGQDIILYFSEALDHDECDYLIDIFETAPFTDTIQEGPVAYAPAGGDTHSLKYKDGQGRIIYNLLPGNPNTEKVIDLIGERLPSGRDFGVVSFCQIIKNETGSLMAYHKDEADNEDTATSIIYLNDDFTGGKFFLDGHVFTAHKGSILGFNNSKDRYHAVEPIYSGSRYVVALWFKHV